METVATLIKFELVNSGATQASSTTNTYDFNWMLILFLLLSILFFSLVVLFFTYKSEIKNGVNQLTNIGYLLSNKIFLSVLLTTISVVLLSGVLLNVLYETSVANAQDTPSNVPAEAKLCIDDSNKEIYSSGISICNFDTETDLYLKSITISSKEEILKDSVWKLTSENDELYNDFLNSKAQFDNPIIISPKIASSLTLSTNLDAETAKQLISKCPISISYEIYQDFNVHGSLIDSNENIMTNCNINLIDDNNSIVSSTTTDSKGNYSFFNVAKNSNVYVSAQNQSSRYTYKYNTEQQMINSSMVFNQLVLGPAHDNLKSYTIKELQYVSNDFASNPGNEQGTSTSQYWNEFYEDNGYVKAGLKGDGLDNCTKAIEDSHWAIDSNNRIAIDKDFAKEGTKVFEFRIIGINQDYKDKEEKQYAGLTFMATHCCFFDEHGIGVEYEVNNDVYAKYGWEGDEEGGKCTLQSALNDTPNFVPSSLEASIVPVYKEYGISNDNYNVRSVANKIWAPSLHELCNYKEDERPYYEKEGNYYLGFKAKNVTMKNGISCLKFIQFKQDEEKNIKECFSSSDDVEIHMRSLFNSENLRSLNFGALSGMLNLGDCVYYKIEVCPCFCI